MYTVEEMNFCEKILLIVMSVALILTRCFKQIPAVASPPTFQIIAGSALEDALRHFGDYEEGIIAYTRVIESEPKNFEAQYGLGRVCGMASLVLAADNNDILANPLVSPQAGAVYAVWF